MTSDALFAAIVGGGTVDDVHCLLSAGVDPNRPFRDGMCPLNAAIAARRLDIVRLLLATDIVDVNQADSFRLDGCRRQPVHYAAACDCDDVVDTLLSLGVDVDQPDDGEATPLHHAAASGNLGLVEYLLQRRVDVNHVSNSGRTALWKAAQAGHRQVVLRLVAAGAAINTQNQNQQHQPLLELIEEPSSPVVCKISWQRY
ncbi:hypothetical protein LSAT2_027839 [Lamellibrachia satsuma]|nr:hypothetical protein LSAT2_027839 [Lamellibrachia satsuma]